MSRTACAPVSGTFWAYRAAIGVVIDTLELPGPIYRVTVSFQARYLTTLEDQDESQFEPAEPNRPR